MTALPFDWPVLGFGPDLGPVSDVLVTFPSAAWFEICTSTTLKHGYRIGMILVDAAGRSWEIQAIQKLGPAGPIWFEILRAIFAGGATYRIGVDLAEREPMPLEVVKARVLAIMESHSDQWRDHEAEAGEDGPPVDGRIRLNELKGRVQCAKSLAGVIKAAEVLVAE